MQLRETPVLELRKELSDEDRETFDEYFDLLVKKEYGFWCSKEEAALFQDIDFDFCFPSVITNAILDLGKPVTYPLDRAFDELDALGCKYLQIRFFQVMDIQSIQELIKPLAFNRLQSVELLIPWYEGLTEEDLRTLCRRNIKITSVIVSGYHENLSVLAGVNKITRLTFTRQRIMDCSSCGNIHHVFFAVNIQAFSEALKYNSCLNGKISIDMDGNIKNCPSMTKGFGKFGKVKLVDALMGPGFKDSWGANKDKIRECMDCEFRYMCTDCRAYLKDHGDPLSKPLKCNYDPYTAMWKNQITTEVTP